MKYFVEIVEAGNYSRAAERLFVAQSALSRQMQELENDVQALLMIRGARHVELTQAGQLFYERSKRILEDVTETIRQVHHVSKGEQGILRLLHSSSVSLTPQFGVVLNSLLEAFPGVSLGISNASSEQQARDIDEGRADLGLIRLPTLRKYPNIVQRELLTEKLVVAVSRHSPLAQQGSTDIASLRDAFFVSIPHKERGGLSYLVAGLCQAHGFFPKAARALSRKTTQLNLVDANLGIAIVPESMKLMAPPGVCFLDLPQPEAVSMVGLIHHRVAPPLVAAFVEAFVDRMRS